MSTLIDEKSYNKRLIEATISLKNLQIQCLKSHQWQVIVWIKTALGPCQHQNLIPKVRTYGAAILNIYNTRQVCKVIVDCGCGEIVLLDKFVNQPKMRKRGLQCCVTMLSGQTTKSYREVRVKAEVSKKSPPIS